MDKKRRHAMIVAERDELHRQIECLEAEVAALEAKDMELRMKQFEIEQDMAFDEFESRLKSIQEENNEQKLDALVTFLCEIRNYIEDNMLISIGTPESWRIKHNGDVYNATGENFRFNVFNVTMETLKVEMGLK